MDVTTAPQYQGQMNAINNGPIDWAELVHLVEESNSCLPQIKGKNIILLIGPTGAGKSTTIHYLNGTEMILPSGQKAPQFKNPLPTEFEKIKIGSESKSETRFISAVESCPERCKPLVLVDTPGFSDTEGKTMDIANIVSITNTLKYCSRSFLLLVIPYAYLTVDRGSLLRKLLDFVHSLFSSTNDINADSITIFFTQVPQGIDENAIIAEIEAIRESKSAGNTDAVNNMLDFILDEIKVVTLNPFEKGSKFRKFRGSLKDGLDGSKFQFQLPSDIHELVASNLKEIELNVINLAQTNLEQLSVILEGFLHLKEHIPLVGTSLKNCCNQLESWVEITGQNLISQLQSSMAHSDLKQELFHSLCWFKAKLKEMSEKNVMKHLKPDLMNENTFAQQIFHNCWDFKESIAQGPERKLHEFEAKRDILRDVVQSLKWDGFQEILAKMEEFVEMKTKAVQMKLDAEKLNFDNLDEVATLLDNLKNSSSATNVSEVTGKQIYQFWESFNHLLGKLQATLSNENPFGMLPSTGKRQSIDVGASLPGKRQAIGDQENPFACIKDEPSPPPPSGQSKEIPEVLVTIESISKKIHLFEKVIHHEGIVPFLDKNCEAHFASMVHAVSTLCEQEMMQVQEKMKVEQKAAIWGELYQRFTIIKEFLQVHDKIKSKHLEAFNTLIKQVRDYTAITYHQIVALLGGDPVPYYEEIIKKMKEFKTLLWLEEFVQKVSEYYASIIKYFNHSLHQISRFIEEKWKQESFSDLEKMIFLLQNIRGWVSQYALHVRVDDGMTPESNQHFIVAVDTMIAISSGLKTNFYNELWEAIQSGALKTDLELSEPFFRKLHLIEMHVSKYFETGQDETIKKEFNKVVDSVITEKLASISGDNYESTRKILKEFQALENSPYFPKQFKKFEEATLVAETLLEQIHKSFTKAVNMENFQIAHQVMAKYDVAASRLREFFPTLMEKKKNALENFENKMHTTYPKLKEALTNADYITANQLYVNLESEVEIHNEMKKTLIAHFDLVAEDLISHVQVLTTISKHYKKDGLFIENSINQMCKFISSLEKIKDLPFSTKPKEMLKEFDKEVEQVLSRWLERSTKALNELKFAQLNCCLFTCCVLFDNNFRNKNAYFKRARVLHTKLAKKYESLDLKAIVNQLLEKRKNEIDRIYNELSDESFSVNAPPPKVVVSTLQEIYAELISKATEAEDPLDKLESLEDQLSTFSPGLKAELGDAFLEVKKYKRTLSERNDKKLEKFNRIIESNIEQVPKFLEKNKNYAKFYQKKIAKKLEEHYRDLEKASRTSLEDFVTICEVIDRLVRFSNKNLTDISNTTCIQVENTIRHLIHKLEDQPTFNKTTLVLLIRANNTLFVLHCLSIEIKTKIKEFFTELAQKLERVKADFYAGLFHCSFQAILSTVQIIKEFFNQWEKYCPSQLTLPPELKPLGSVPPYSQCKKEIAHMIEGLPKLVSTLWAKKDVTSIEAIISSIKQSQALSNHCDMSGCNKVCKWVNDQCALLYQESVGHMQNMEHEKFNAAYSNLREWKKLEKLLDHNYVELVDQKIVSQIDTVQDSFKRQVGAPSPEKIAAHLVDLKEFEDKFPHTKDKIVIKIQEILKSQKDSQTIMKIGIFLQKEGRLGCEIVADYPQFARIQQEMWKKKTQNQDIKFTLQHFQTSDEKASSMWTVIKDWTGLENEKLDLEKYYMEFDEAFRRLVELHLVEKNLGIKKIVSKTRNLLTNRRKPAINILLAHIFAVWSIEKSQINIDAGSTDHMQYILQPHSAQVVSLFRLLGEKNVLNSLKASHLIEILTGEGKSVILGVASIYLALTGCEATVISYSEYLSARDAKEFEQMFQHFGVENSVKYLPIDKLAEEMVNSKGDIRKLVSNTLAQAAQKDKAQANAAPASQIVPISIKKKKILLIDEVDVFFGANFYGRTYDVSATYTNSEIYELFKYVWENKATLDYHSIQKSACFTKAAAQFPASWRNFMIAEVNRMINDAKQYNEPPYILVGERIGYAVHDSVDFTLTHGYKTTFAYLNEFEKGNIASLASFKSKVGFLIYCGAFCYSKLPKKYSIILGVTGTLCLTKIEKQIVEQYAIKKLSYAPSVYGAPRRQFDTATNVCVLKAKSEWFLRISQQISDKINSQRAVITFFETRALIEEFLQQQNGQISNFNILDESTAYKENLIRKATASRNITFCTRPFGRGVDFVCRDETTTQNGGVHVVVTFFPSSTSEEIQIKGRTARQGDPGSLEMILLESDLITTLNITAETIQNSKGGDSLYKMLVQKRDKVLDDAINERMEQDNKSQHLHEKSVSFRKLLTNQMANQSDAERLKALLEINSLSTSAPYHFYFCLDDSGSMSGAPWKDLTGAVIAFITKRIEFLTTHKFVVKDLVTIINYSDSVSVACSNIVLDSPGLTKKIVYRRGGGTNFAIALATCHSEIARAQPEHIPVLLFMSDGASNNGEKEMRELGKSFPQLKVYTIGFGIDCAAGKLEGMANLVNGKYFFGADGASLKAEFEAICKEINAPSHI